MFKLIASLTLVLTVSGFSSVALAFAEDIAGVYELALARDARLQSAAFKVDGQRFDVPLSRGMLLPQATFAVYGSATKQHTYDKDSYLTSGYSLTLNVPVWHWDRLIAYRQAVTGVAAAELAFAAEKQGLIMRVAKLYFDILDASAQLEVAKTKSKSMAMQQERAQGGVDAGTAVLADLLVAQSEYDAAKAMVIAAENTLNTRQEWLVEVIGSQKEALHLLPLKATVPLLNPDPKDPKAWVRFAKEKNLELRALRAKAEISVAEIKKAQAGHYPTVDLNIGHNYVENKASPMWFGGEQRNESAMVQMTVPLYQGGMVDAKVSQALAGHQEAVKEVERLERGIVGKVNNAYRDVLTGIAQVKAFGQAMKSAEAALKTTNESYQAGLRTMVDLLGGENGYHEARKNFANAKHQYVLATLQLKFVAGLLAPEDLRQINGWLQQ